MKETEKKPVKFRWIMVIVLATWGFMVICFQLGLVYWKDFTFVHTLLMPIVLLVALAPFSVKSIVSSRLAKPGIAVWAGTMVPATYLVARQLTSFGNHCDLAFMAGGAIIFLALIASWAIKPLIKWSKKLEASVVHG